MSPRRVLLFAAALLAALGVWAGIAGSTIPPALNDVIETSGRSDESLYETIAQRVAGGDGYYAAAVEEQVRAGYPTSPPPSVRLPTTTFVVAGLGDAAPWALRILIAVTALAAMVRFERFAQTRVEWVLSVLLLAASLGIFAHPDAVVVSEAWAVCFIVLSLLAHSAGRWQLSVILALVAVCFRELALPVLAVMAVMSWRRERRESLAWTGALAVFLAGYGLHWVLVSRAAGAVASVESPSWWRFGGWPFVVDTFAFSSVLRVAPYLLAVVLIALAIVGWLAVEGDYRDRALAVSLTFIAIFMIIGRPDTAYWGRLYVALLFPGLAFAPRAIYMMIRGGPRAPVSDRVAA